MKPEKTCPMVSGSTISLSKCAGERCAWWDIYADECCILSHAEYNRTLSDNLEAVSMLMEERNNDE